MKRRTEITIETDHQLIIRKRVGIRSAQCGTCNKQVTMITADVAAKLAGLSSRALYRLIEADRIHFIELHDGSSLICLSSLNQLLNVEKQSIG
jgi:hypothetical protein